MYGNYYCSRQGTGSSPFNLEEHEMFDLIDPSVGKNELGEEKSA